MNSNPVPKQVKASPVEKAATSAAEKAPLTDGLSVAGRGCWPSESGAGGV